MKTLTKLLLAIACVCLLIACSKSDDDLAITNSQSSLKNVNVKGTGTISGYHEFDNYELPVFCNNEQVDVLLGKLYVHYEQHWNNGNFMWANHEIKGEAVSTSGSGEVFKLIDIPHKYDPNLAFQYETYNYIGNQGTHYVGTLAWDNITWELTIIRAKCPGN